MTIIFLNNHSPFGFPAPSHSELLLTQGRGKGMSLWQVVEPNCWTPEGSLVAFAWPLNLTLQIGWLPNRTHRMQNWLAICHFHLLSLLCVVFPPLNLPAIEFEQSMENICCYYFKKSTHIPIRLDDAGPKELPLSRPRNYRKTDHWWPASAHAGTWPGRGTLFWEDNIIIPLSCVCHWKQVVGVEAKGEVSQVVYNYCPCVIYALIDKP